eukprot:CAMPEP_0170465218 /NCGR_PEP_ID=MMETSP0123-20130129/9643_1 /TAXON_ID=182087 /ORGANISM="Favella ehrenbergii, Strain Fehren 1" /LENGTH=137 /DNA_ID=CAMNT_0010731057 /DNA_START=247 /DNA_END=660 /DNA_ORIENTATION=+
MRLLFALLSALLLTKGTASLVSSTSALLLFFLLSHKLLVICLATLVHAHQNSHYATNGDGNEQAAQDQPYKDRNEFASFELIAIRIAHFIESLGPIVVTEVPSLDLLTRGDAACTRKAPEEAHEEPGDEVAAFDSSQ